MIPKTISYQIEELLQTNTTFSLRRAEQIAKEYAGKNPDDANAQISLGKVFFATEALDEALDCFERARQIAPELPQAWKFTASILYLQKKLPKALEYGQRAYVLAGDSAEGLSVRVILGVILMTSAQFEQAKRVLSQVKNYGFRCEPLLLCHWLTGDLDQLLSAMVDTAGLPQIGMLPPQMIDRREAYLPFFEFKKGIHSLLMDGDSPDLILDSLDLPPDDLAPGTLEYVDWWRQELSDPHWEEDVRATLDVLSNTELTEKIQESRNEPKEERTSWKDLKSTLVL